MNRQQLKEQMRKSRWAEEKQKGKKLGKKDLIKVQEMVMQMGLCTQSTQPPQLSNSTWRGTQKEPVKMTIDLSNLIGKNFGGNNGKK
jgi:hypothetical protein